MTDTRFVIVCVNHGSSEKDIIDECSVLMNSRYKKARNRLAVILAGVIVFAIIAHKKQRNERRHACCTMNVSH